LEIFTSSASTVMALLQRIVPIVLLVSLTFSAGLVVNRAAMLDTVKRVGVLLRALIAVMRLATSTTFPPKHSCGFSFVASS
jgi:hypothetical protein